MSRKSEWCRHFTGIQNKVCKAGVKYDDVRDSSTSPYRWPCTLGGGACDKLEEYSPEEIEEQERQYQEYFGRMLKARAAIKATGERQGIIDCPCCDKGQLGFAIASNGHVHAACSTAGCVRWME